MKSIAFTARIDPAWRMRWGIAARVLTAVFGGYALAALASVALALWLHASRAEATMWGMLSTFTIYTCAVMWSFAARSAARACAGLLLPIVLLGVSLAVHQWGAS